MTKYIGWFSCGVTSAVACKIAIDSGKDVDLWYIETGAEHEDNRALRLKEQQTPNCYFPLIEKRLNKQACLMKLKTANIEIPEMYKLGYHNNNNCIGCFKGGMGYWNKIRKDFPVIFEATSKLEQETRHTVLKDNGQQLYLKDLSPDKGNQKDLEIPDCGLFCDVSMEGLPIKELEEVRKELLQC